MRGYVTSGECLQLDVARFGDQHGAQADRQIGDTGGVIADVAELVGETGARMDVIAELRHQGAAAASLVRGLSDEQLDRAGELLGRQRRARDVIEGILISHVRNHLGSIREALTA